MREVQSDQTQVSSGCIVHVSWTVPDGFLAHEIQHFMVYVNDTRTYNESLGNETIAMRAYNMCTCDIHKIKLSAIDACGNVGKNHSFSVKKPEPLPDSELECKNIGGKTPLPTPNHILGIDVPLIIVILINNNIFSILRSIISDSSHRWLDCIWCSSDSLNRNDNILCSEKNHQLFKIYRF